jgi:3-hydroxyacyl-CoA dehydrogenase
MKLLNIFFFFYLIFIEADKAQLYADELIESLNFAGQVLCLSRIEETINDAQIIIECVAEDYDVKSILFEKMSLLCPIDCILVTSTLRFDIAKLAEKIKHKERFLGLRFLYPVYCISEVCLIIFIVKCNLFIILIQ